MYIVIYTNIPDYQYIQSIPSSPPPRLSHEGVGLVHPALPHATAEALGVRSLRYRQQAGSDIGALDCMAHR